MMGKSKEIERELIFCQAKIESLEEQLRTAHADKEVLVEQINRLQDALISVRAPEAYRDQIIEREDARRVPIDPEVLERNRITKEVTEAYLNGMERPLFRTGDDMEDLLTTSLLRHHKPAASLHGNDES